ncbi:translocase tim22 17-like protein [Vairimorpha apis BRL 01]|uniref:Translocase tim22 17-like protein n=1 Tax=Vairimorpha apis BRL 01 TaxID=1037528 RepID=T0MIH5_9MICR|nr:translocase tim22 17-like protein [Vairimorpha apis BRL 01]
MLNKVWKFSKPKIYKTVSDTLQGYLFGCMMGIFTNKNDLRLKSIHNTGKDMAQVCAIYSVSESVLDTMNKDDKNNKLLAGMATGIICSKDKFISHNTLLGGVSLSLYKGMLN